MVTHIIPAAPYWYQGRQYRPPERTKPLRKNVSPLKWHGGKHYLATWIRQHAPVGYRHYVEPYAGSAAVLFRRPWGRYRLRGSTETISDLHADLIGFYHVLRDPFRIDKLINAARCLAHSAESWQAARDLLARGEGGPIRRAVAFLAANRMSRQGLMRDYVTPSTRPRRGGLPEHLSAWLSALDRLPHAHRRLRGVEILQVDALELIRERDTKGTWMYLDPPYMHSTRRVTDAYQHEMSEAEHVRLLETVVQCRSHITLSGYPSEVYDRYLRPQLGWRCEHRFIGNSASSTKRKEVKTECLWMNY